MKTKNLKNILALVLAFTVILMVMSISVGAMNIKDSAVSNGVAPITGGGAGNNGGVNSGVGSAANGGSGNDMGGAGLGGDMGGAMNDGGINGAVDSVVPDGGMDVEDGVVTDRSGGAVGHDNSAVGDANADDGNTIWSVIGVIVGVLALLAVLIIVIAMVSQTKAYNDGDDRRNGDRR